MNVFLRGFAALRGINAETRGLEERIAENVAKLSEGE